MVGMSLERQQLLALVSIPDLDRPIDASAGHALAVGAEGHAADIFRVSLQHLDFLSCRGMPDLDQAIAMTADDAFTVGTVRHAMDEDCIEADDLFTRDDVPDQNGV